MQAAWCAGNRQARAALARPATSLPRAGIEISCSNLLGFTCSHYNTLCSKKQEFFAVTVKIHRLIQNVFPIRGKYFPFLEISKKISKKIKKIPKNY
jgi:hypothetical protein